MQSTITRNRQKTGALKSVVFFMMLCMYSVGAKAQIRGLITQPSTAAGQAVMDPNKDGYVSSSKNGFAANDVAESEIPYKALPQLSQDPSGDLAMGPTGGFTDFVDIPSEQAVSMYVDANNNLMFRFRLGRWSPNSKGYSVLIDTDNKFGNSGPNADPNYTAANPGFEIELVLRTNFGVDINDVDGRSTPLTKATLNYNAYSQKAIAFTMTNGDYDYFYDFYVPISAITAHFSNFSASTAVRMVGNTVIAPKSALEGPISDIGGVNDALYNYNTAAAWTALVNNFVPTTLSGIQSGNSFSADRSDAPVIGTPIVATANSITGTSTEAFGTTIRVFRNGTQIGTTTVQTGGAWTLSGITVTAGDEITATAQATGESVSLASNTVIVGGTTCSTPPTLNCASDKGIIVNGPAGATINIYRITTAGPQLISSGPIVSGTYMYKCNDKFQNCQSGNRCVVDGTYYFTATEPGKCESAPSAYSNNGCTSGSTAPTISVSSTTALSGTTNVSGQTIIIRLDDVTYGTATAATTLTNGSYAWSFSGFSATAGQVVSVRGLSTGECVTVANNVTITAVAAAPVITSTSLTTVSSQVSGTSTEADGAVVTVYRNGTAIGTATVFGGVWTLNSTGTTFGFSSNDGITARVTTAPNKTISDASNTVTVASATTRIPSITAPVLESATSVSGTSTSPAGTVIRLFLDGDYIGQATVVSGSGGNNTWTVNSLDPAFKFYPGGILTATATENGLQEGLASSPVVIQCVTPLNTPTVTSTNACQTFTADVTITGPQAGVLYRLMNGTTPLSSYAVALSGANTLVITTNALPNVTTLTISVEAMKLAPSICSTTLSNTATVNVFGLPNNNNNVTTSPSPASVCSGTSVSINISNSEVGVNYQLRNGTTNVGTALGGNNGLLTLTANLAESATLNILATNATSQCSRQLTTTVNITVNAQQKTIEAVNSIVCSGGNTDIRVLNSEAGTTYQLSNSSAFSTILATATSSTNGSTITLNTGVINANTTFYVRAIKSSCSTIMTSTATVNLGNPANRTVNASATSICSGGTVTFSVVNSEFGVNYQLQQNGSPVGSALPGTGSSVTPLSFPALSPTATTAPVTYNYSVIATRTSGSCTTTTLTAPSVTVNVQPAQRTISAASSLICTGGSTTISVASPQTGVTYQLRTGSTNVGSPQSGSTVSFTVSPTNNTTYNVLAYSTSGSCSLTMTSTAIVYVNGQKVVAAVSGTLCAGQSTDITVANSALGVNYSLFAGSSTTAIATIPGDGGTIGFPTGAISANTTYTVRGEHGNGSSACNQVAGTATVNITNPNGGLTVTAQTSSVCSGNGTNINVAGTETGVSYQLRIVGGSNVGTPVNGGNGTTISLPTGALTVNPTQFEVVATRSQGGCSTVLTQKQSVAVNPQPGTRTVTGPSSNICFNSTASITVSNVEANVSYILRNGTNVIDTKTGVAGTTVTLNTGVLTNSTTFNVIAATTSCTTTLATSVPVTVVATQRTVQTLATEVCQGGSTFIEVVASGSTTTIYNLYRSTNLSAPIASAAGTNGGTIQLSTGAINATTTFVVIATNGSCNTTMSNQPTVSVVTPAANNPVKAPKGVCSGSSATINVENTVFGVTYFLRNASNNAVVTQANGNGGTINLVTGAITSPVTYNVLAVHSTLACSTALTTTVTVDVDCQAVYSPSSVTYPTGYQFTPHESIATVSDADGFDLTSVNTAVITSGAFPAGVSINNRTGQIFVSNVNAIVASAATVGIRTTDVNGKTTDHVFVITIVNPGTPLPVDFISFNGKLADNKVELTWATAWEVNNDFYTIERSADGIRFQAIGTKKGAGNSTQLLNYSFTDAYPLSGVSYYRIKQTDFNGEFDYSKTIVIRNFHNNERSISMSVYPNPAVGTSVNINLPGSKGQTMYLQVVDVMGRVMIDNYSVMEDNFTSLQLTAKDGNRLKPGVYTIITIINGEKLSSKLIVN